MQVLSTIVELGSVSGTVEPGESSGLGGGDGLDFSDVFAEHGARQVPAEDPETDVNAAIEEQLPEAESKDPQSESDSVEKVPALDGGETSAEPNEPVIGPSDIRAPEPDSDSENRTAQKTAQKPDRAPEVDLANKHDKEKPVAQAVQEPDPRSRIGRGEPPVAGWARQGAGLAGQGDGLAWRGDGLAQQDGELVRRGDGLVQQDGELARRGDGLVQQNGELARRGDGLAQQDGELARRGDGLAQQDGEMVRRGDGLVRQNGEMVRRGDGLVRQDSEMVRRGIPGPVGQATFSNVQRNQQENKSELAGSSARQADGNAAAGISQAGLSVRITPSSEPAAAHQFAGPASPAPVAETVARASHVPPLADTRPTKDLPHNSPGQDHFEFALPSTDGDVPSRRRPAPSHPATGAARSVKRSAVAVSEFVKTGAAVSSVEVDLKTTGPVLSSEPTAEAGLRMEQSSHTNAVTVQHAKPEAVRSAAAQAIEVFARNPDRKVEIAMNPEELGRVRMSLSTSDSSVMVHISAERPETQDLMRRHLDQLINEFRRLGYEDIAFDFGDARDQRDGASGSPQGHPGSGEPIAQDTADVVARPRNLNTTALDIRL